MTNTYGPRVRIKDAKQTFIDIWLRNIIEKKPIIIFGDGLQVRDLTYIDDLVDAFLLSAISNSDKSEIFNLGGEKISLLDLAKTFQSINPNCKYELQPFPIDRKAIDIGNYYADDSKIKKLLGWESKTNLFEGLKKCLDFYEENSHYYL
ncbi:hypothetical protein JCM31447_24960 [Fluviispira sanaruensis]|uniref:NAD-dependent epimerase/dehydratase domain-containing protein n=1 Tax=Fluviispira sanaruensis TaxID=2493639 RepID=A0A4P2VQ30_FLUSA|nr:hypothetical protein JCM31447_24960 [Fluviispira sanaruensis]